MISGSLTRREFLRLLGLLGLSPALVSLTQAEAIAKTLQQATNALLVNDQHFQLNSTRVANIFKVQSLADIQSVLSRKKPLSIAGGRHSAGGQQFLSNGLLIDTTAYQKVLGLNQQLGLVEIESGIQWPQLIQYLLANQREDGIPWGIIQKPTGTDRISLGGSLSSNVHGRGLRFSPIIQDVESFTLINANGKSLLCSRSESPELFSLAIGGYGLFGMIQTITLRLQPRCQIKRRVRLLHIEELIPAFNQAKIEGATYGDFQFYIDPNSSGFLTEGIFASYLPISTNTTDPSEQHPESNTVLSLDDWAELVYLAHTDKKKAFDKYVSHYLSTDGQIYWNDTSQTGPYKDGYHDRLDKKLQDKKLQQVKSSEGITEVYVPYDKLPDFMKTVAADFRQNNVNLIYGTIRLIEKDTESFLPWAKQTYACIIFNLHTPHTPIGIEENKKTFQRLIDYALERGGSYYLTYHRFARKDQVLSCYPQFRQFLKLKQYYDPQERFQSNWYHHYKTMFKV